MKSVQYAIFLILLLFLGSSFALNNPLPADQAFQFSVKIRDNQTILADWKIKPTYYLYRDRIYFQVIKPKDVRLSQPLMPESLGKVSPEIGNYEVYQGHLIIPVPLLNPPSSDILLQVSYQGCSLNGYCYPPTKKLVSFNMSGPYMKRILPMEMDIATPPRASTDEQHVINLFNGKNLFLFILGFLGLGLLISFTPCVLPMIPILSSIIVGQKQLTHKRAFGVSLAYVFGMALTYSIAGAAFGYFGAFVQVYFQNPWIISLFSLIFVLMAFSMFGFYNIELPNKLRSKIAITSEHQKRGTYFGAFMMGILSTLILSPCVTAPLVAVLSYISQTGNAFLGALGLFTMSIGMGVPLLIIGLLGPKLLPKTGAWMNTIKFAMGFMMLFMAVYLLSRIISGSTTLFLYAIILAIFAIYLGAFTNNFTRQNALPKTIGILFFIYAILLTVGAYIGNSNPFNPLGKIGQSEKTQTLQFIKVSSIKEVQDQITLAQQNNKMVMLDFYADWCVACKTMDHFTFSNPKVIQALSNSIILRADVTNNSDADKALEQHFNVVAPPTILFFKNGEELPKARIIGEMSATDFLSHLRQLN